MTHYISPLADDIAAAAANVETARGERAHRIARTELIRVLTVALVLRDGTKCAYCRIETHTGGGHQRHQRTFDHVVPRIQGGADTLENGLLACRSRNGRKKDRNIRSFAPRAQMETRP